MLSTWLCRFSTADLSSRIPRSTAVTSALCPSSKNLMTWIRNMSQQTRHACSLRYTWLSTTINFLSLSMNLTKTCISASLNIFPTFTIPPNSFLNPSKVNSPFAAPMAPPASRILKTASVALSTSPSTTYCPATLFHVSDSLYSSSAWTSSSCSSAHQSGFPIT